MYRGVFVLVVSAVSVLGAAGAEGAQPPPVSEKAEILARNVRGMRAGADRKGNLWAWSWPGNRVDLYSPMGELEASVQIVDAIDLDADRSWGVAAVSGFGHELRLVSFEGSFQTVIPLPDRAQGVAWIDQNRVAVAPALAAHRVEIWDVEKKVMIRKLGEAVPLRPGPGVTLLRNVLLKFHPQSNLLYTLESFQGDLQVFSLSGALVKREMIPKPDRAALEAAIEQDGKERRARNEVLTPAITWFRLAIDEEGTVWSVQSCDRAQGKATLFKWPAAGKPSLITVEEPCCQLALTLWNGRILLYSQPGAPGALCNSLRRAP